MRENQGASDFILDGGSVVTDMQIESECGDFGIRMALPQSGWTQARSMAARTTPKHPAPPVPTARAECRDGVMKAFLHLQEAGILLLDSSEDDRQRHRAVSEERPCIPSI